MKEIGTLQEKLERKAKQNLDMELKGVFDSFSNQINKIWAKNHCGSYFTFADVVIEKSPNGNTTFQFSTLLNKIRKVLQIQIEPNAIETEVNNFLKAVDEVKTRVEDLENIADCNEQSD